MSAQPDQNITRAMSAASFAPMQQGDLYEVIDIERVVYSAPWTLGNFSDSLSAGHSAWVLRMGPHQTMVGYFVVLVAAGEAHLLNISVAANSQNQGHGYTLLQKATAVARLHRAEYMILEVRPSNVRALKIYERYGFHQVGIRRGYYPVSSADQRNREDALVMKLPL